MNEILPTNFSSVYLWPLLLIVVLLIWLIVRGRTSQSRSLTKVLDSISFDRIEALIIPNADEGEIQIDYLVLTAQGLLIVDVKDVNGAVFG